MKVIYNESDKLFLQSNQNVTTNCHKIYTKAEVFYYVNYVNVNYSVKNSTVDCKYEFPDDFLNNQLYWHFLYYFGFYLKKSCRKTEYLQSTVEFFTG